MDVALWILGAAATAWGLAAGVAGAVRSQRRRREGVTVVTQPTYRAKGVGLPLELVQLEVTITNNGLRAVDLVWLHLGDPELGAMLDVPAQVAPVLPMSLQPDVPLYLTLASEHLGPTRLPDAASSDDAIVVVARTRRADQPLRSASSPRIPLQLS